MTCRPKQSACRPGAPQGNPTLRAVVRSYIMHNRPQAQRELNFFAQLPSLELAIESAALATDECGKRFDHQRRIKRASLRHARTAFLGALSTLRDCKSFDDLHSLVCALTANIAGLGELYRYDTCLRLGAYMGLSPTRVYLHAGTRVGAKALGFPANVPHLDSRELPAEFQVLEPYEIEDVLCIYKGPLGELKG